MDDLTNKLNSVRISEGSKTSRKSSNHNSRSTPDGWSEFSTFHKSISTPELPFTIIPIKAPLDNSPSEKWTWSDIKLEISKYVHSNLQKRCSIAAVFDLTATKIDSPKYYKGSQLFNKHKIFYNKVQVMTHGNLPNGEKTTISRMLDWGVCFFLNTKTSG